ncbi:hypothetical protein GJ689_24645 [Rhodoplanes serenus]|uniref:Uncharacterized protein n=1 Tax=Rhodoplanes serenus TaxID=200615 RepID=A0A9X5AVS2_9BRAD|nr:hypothetical protein [Rhodoplanes serenus]MTW19383.1 hypothetical protein [Rhodoplanes serenus]
MWTSALVGAALVEAFGAMPDRPIYSPSPNVLLPADGGDGRPFDIVSLSAVILGRSAPARVEVLTWARHKAARRLRTAAAAYGIDRGAQRRRVALTLQRLADELNAAGIRLARWPGAEAYRMRDRSGPRAAK